ncbi:M48 family metallopeptidase [Ectobacillus antri]|jgi:STE24 endopeptidase|uniref:M48 family metallopeptidase n=1 Tax=Ectobacillus antri TaxID=2486280 RepID=A0ABT6H5C0_9BACI|nr:M48 family metallopeptidase [Ectobacillus antri]MDG4656718.1 M48 family metallopeptidase [Ectobacillus antri]MDG5753919.1 M48 family metallopeptidase [Ectobacillus antri]
MKKVIGWSLFLYVGFGLFIYWYLFYGTSTAIPEMYKGSSADPATFMSQRELVLSQDFSRIKYLLYFLATPFEWLVLLLILVLGISRNFEKWAKQSAKPKILQIGVYLFYLSLLTTALALPFQWISYQVSKFYHISTQTTASWVKDHIIDFWVNFVFMFVIVAVLLWLMKRSERWWLYAWCLSVPFTIFMTFIQPVFIDPLYNDFQPLQNKQLETKILKLAQQADIPASHVYEVNMSEKTNALNAYVTGIGSNSRIVLWDTTLKQLSENEILFIMAHEMAHYVKKHIYWALAGSIALSFVGLYLISRLINRTIRKFGHIFHISSITSFSVLPLFFLFSSVLSFAASPAMNYVSRAEERASDTYAMELTNDNKAAVMTFQNLSKTSLSQVNPPGLVKFFLYTHPTILERIQYLEQYEKK